MPSWTSLQGHNIRTSSHPTLVSVWHKKIDYIVASLSITFPDDDSLVPVICCMQDNLPLQVKGSAIWLLCGISSKGYYIPQEYTTLNNNEPVEFINQQWHGLVFHQQTLSTRWSLAIAFANSLGLGWWAPTDPVHPDYQPPQLPHVPCPIAPFTPCRMLTHPRCQDHWLLPHTQPPTPITWIRIHPHPL